MSCLLSIPQAWGGHPLSQQGVLCLSPGAFSALTPLPLLQYGRSGSVRYSVWTKWLLPSHGGETRVSPGAEQHLRPESPTRGTGRVPQSRGCAMEGLHTLGSPRDPDRPWAPAPLCTAGAAACFKLLSHKQPNTNNNCNICSPSHLAIAGRFLPVRAERVAMRYPSSKRLLLEACSVSLTPTNDHI